MNESRTDRPSWLDGREAEPFKIDGESATNVGVISLPISNRLEAGYRASELEAKRGLCSAAGHRIAYVTQTSEKSAAAGEIKIQHAAADACQMTTAAIRFEKRFYERAEVLQENGTKKQFYRIFTLVSIPLSDLKTALSQNAKRMEQEDQAFVGFGSTIEKTWNNFTDPSYRAIREPANTGQ